MRNFNPQSKQTEITNEILNTHYEESGFTDSGDYNYGKNSWLKDLLNVFTHQDSSVNRLQGWLKPEESPKYSLNVPAMEVDCYNPVYGLYVTIHLR